MGKTLNEIADELKKCDKKVQLIYAFNGTGKTRLSKIFQKKVDEIVPASKNLSFPMVIPEEGMTFGEEEKVIKHVLYYNAFTEDLFYWDNDLENDSDRKLIIQSNYFIPWLITDWGLEETIINHFQHYTDEKLLPKFVRRMDEKGNLILSAQGKEIIDAVSFSYQRGNEADKQAENIKISKGEESNFIWSIFYSMIENIVDILNVIEDRETDVFDDLQYVFIDDPVSSLDENHLIEVASNLGDLIFSSKSELKFIITTHNPIFFNVLANEIKRNKKKEQQKVSGTDVISKKKVEVISEKKKKIENHVQSRLERHDDGTYDLVQQDDDSPFSYHQFIRNEIKNAIETEQVYKYHFNLLRNLYEKTSTFLGHENWKALLPDEKDSQGNKINYEKRILDISSHSKNSADEGATLPPSQRQLLKILLDYLEKESNFKKIRKQTYDQ
ncbi:MAG: AAA family ATPase [Streptococcaceae bacterium]|jgi:hypothetical protein|nr:AAA family ATPase [Streptococcaceae bacterium]